MTAPAVSVLLATRDRAELLSQLLESLEVARVTAGVETQLIVVDNGSTDATAGLLHHWAAAGPGRIHLHEARPGKSRALNRALQVAGASLLAFVDDDEEVAPEWLSEILRFFGDHPEYPAASGRVLPPPGLTDTEVLARLAAYRTVAFFDDGPAVGDLPELHGGNMVLRREVFDRAGGFDESLGPGAAGGCEDVDLGQRLQRVGMRIGYMPNVVVYHSVDPARLTPAAFHRFQMRVARSRFAMDPQRAARKAVPRLAESALAFAWWSVRGERIRRERAWGRVLLHKEVLRLWWRRHLHRRAGAALP